MVESGAEHTSLGPPMASSANSKRRRFEQTAPVAGPEPVKRPRPRPDHDRQYVRGDRAALRAR